MGRWSLISPLPMMARPKLMGYAYLDFNPIFR